MIEKGRNFERQLFAGKISFGVVMTIITEINYENRKRNI